MIDVGVPPSSDGRRRTIIAAEDNAVHRLVLKRVMGVVAGADGIDLRFVGNGRELIETLEAGARPDLVLVDLHMPVLGGCETVAAIRADPRLCTMPVVMLSSSEQRHHVEAAYRNGVNAYLVKRGEYRMLVDQMRRFVQFWLGPVRLPGRPAG